ncbi:hypothetical protein, partial [Streptomyces lavendulae]|uniref:hypothetical protein n=1 Tax=Streptomyces lavendulae TaxID=1914 RepID=UPI0031EDB0A9
VIHPQVVVRRDVRAARHRQSTVPDMRENGMPKTERRKNNDEKPSSVRAAVRGTRWSRRARRIRNEAAIHLVTGAATAIGGSIVLYVSSRLPLG